MILGENFIKSNPEQAKKYLEKISIAMKATVKISDILGIGSGVMVKDKTGERRIITNAHVVNDLVLNVSFINREKATASVMAKDEKKDIAVLKINKEETKIKYTGTDMLEIEENTDEVKNGDTLASVGNPLDFPFAVGIHKAIRILGFDNILYKKDERFSALELYYRGKDEIFGSRNMIYIRSKGEAISGMSGGPVIELEKTGRPRLVGINSLSLPGKGKEDYFSEKFYDKITHIPNFYGRIREMGYSEEKSMGYLVTSKDIIAFLKEHDLYE